MDRYGPKRRARRVEANLCINSASHGEATDGVLCRPCRLIHRGVIKRRHEALGRTDEQIAEGMTCSRCNLRRPTPGWRTCEPCRVSSRESARRLRRLDRVEPMWDRVHQADQAKIPAPPKPTTPAPMRSCAICADFARCHMTKLDVDGPEYPVCVDCNSKPAEVKNDYRGYDLPAERGDTRMTIDAAYKRIVPPRTRADFRRPEQWESFAEMRRKV